MGDDLGARMTVKDTEEKHVAMEEREFLNTLRSCFYRLLLLLLIVTAAQLARDLQRCCGRCGG